MLKAVKHKLGVLRSGLMRLNHRPIGKAVLAVILFLDLFVLASIFDGLSEHTRQLVAPYEYIPQHCRDIVIDEDWNVESRFKRTAKIISGFTGSYRYIDRNDRANKNDDIHAVCQPIYTLLQAIEVNKALADGLSDYLNDRAQAGEVKSEIERTRSAYDTSLLETIALNTEEAKAEAANAEELDAEKSTQYLKKEISTLTLKLNRLTQVTTDRKLQITKHPLMMTFFDHIDGIKENDRELLLADLRNSNFWFPVKRLAMELLFLMPLILIFYFWNSRSLRTQQPYQILVSSHLLIVAFIPVIFKVLELVYDIMPKKFLKAVFSFLESFNLVAIWHYLMMGLSIALALGLIYILQQKIFSQEKLMQKRISKGLCQSCGVQLPIGSNSSGDSSNGCSNKACTACGFKQYKVCHHCNNNTYVYGQHCKECGLDLEK